MGFNDTLTKKITIKGRFLRLIAITYLIIDSLKNCIGFENISNFSNIFGFYPF
jgi:hypothetical protein